MWGLGLGFRGQGSLGFRNSSTFPDTGEAPQCQERTQQDRGEAPHCQSYTPLILEVLQPVLARTMRLSARNKPNRTGAKRRAAKTYTPLILGILDHCSNKAPDDFLASRDAQQLSKEGPCNIKAVPAACRCENTILRLSCSMSTFGCTSPPAPDIGTSPAWCSASAACV